MTEAAQPQSAGVRMFGYAGSAARFATALSEHVPYGSPAARMSAFTGLAESLVTSRGSPLQALLGGAVTWISSVAGELLQSWAESGGEGAFRRSFVAPIVSAVTGTGDVVPGMKGNPPLTALIGGIYGAVLGFFGSTGRGGRPIKVISSALEQGLRRLVGSWAAERVLDVGHQARPPGNGQVETGIDKWKLGDKIDLVLTGEKLPADRALVESVDASCRERLSIHELRQLDKVYKAVMVNAKRLCEAAGVPYETEREHRLLLTSEDAKYKPLNGNDLTRHSVDTQGESLVRIDCDLYRRRSYQPREIRLDLGATIVRAQLSGTRVIGDDQSLRFVSGFRTRIRKPPGAKVADDVGIEARRFDDAVNIFLSYWMDKAKLEPSEKVTKASKVKTVRKVREQRAYDLQSIYQMCSADDQKRFLNALLVGKREMSLKPLYAFFSHGEVPPPGSNERAALELDILKVNRKRLMAHAKRPAAQAAPAS